MWPSLLALENSLDVASAMQYANYVYAICERHIEHDILADDEAPQIRTKFRSSAANSWPASQMPETLVDAQSECVGITHAVFRDV